MRYENYQLPETGDFLERDLGVLDIMGGAFPDISGDDYGGLIDALAGTQIFVAYDDSGEIAGVTSYYLPNDKDYVYLSGTAVAPELRGQGEVGVAMMRQMKEIAAASGRKAIEGVSTPGAEQFYRRLGAYGVDNHLRMRIDVY